MPNGNYLNTTESKWSNNQGLNNKDRESKWTNISIQETNYSTLGKSINEYAAKCEPYIL